ncbi:MAG: 3'-5' exonuclease [Rhodospirillaceae bacterium]
MKADVMAVVDFETTGLSPGFGARAIEIAAVLVSGGRVVDNFVSLMNPGVSVPYEITQLTGITTKMVKAAPPIRGVMQEVKKFIGDADLVAHNATFDRKFLEAEHRRIGVSRPLNFVCTMLLSRRIFDGLPNYKLGTLVSHLRLPTDGNLHRALADAMVTAELLFRIQAEISKQYGLTLPHRALARVQKTPRKNLEKVLGSFEK